MDRLGLNIIKTRTLSLRENEVSDNIVLVDDIGGDMYFTFMVKYIQEDSVAKTHIEVSDEHHADITIETGPNSIARLNYPILIGTYSEGKELYFDYRVEPAEGKCHTVIITFYTK